MLSALLDGLRGPTVFSHDAFGNLAGAIYPDRQRELRTPDAVGNLFRREDRKDRRYGRAGQLLGQSTQHGEIHYSYDPEGNLIEKREPNGAIWRYAWNHAGMLAKVTRPDGDDVTFGYDALGRRTKKTYRGQTTRWIWDGNVPLHEWVEGELEPPADLDGVPLLNDRDEVKKRDAALEELLALDLRERGTEKQPITWVFEPESFAPMAKLYADRAFLITCDHLGTPVLMSEGEKSVWSAGTSIYGELRNIDGQRHACPFRWPGQYEDAETGLYYNRFRYYDAEAGQYTSQDPIRLHGGRALYSYVPDPQTLTDPFGLAKKPSCGSDLTEHRAEHILSRHRSGAGIPGKTEFPSSWSDGRILTEVSDVATDPRAVRGIGKWSSPYSVAEREGILIRVDFYPDNHPKYAGKISTGYPLNTPANPAAMNP